MNIMGRVEGIKMTKLVKYFLRIIVIVLCVSAILHAPSLIKSYIEYKDKEPTIEELLKEAKVSTAQGYAGKSYYNDTSLEEIEKSTGLHVNVHYQEQSENAYDTVKLMRVVDGDTLCVDFGDAFETRIRLIGCNTPESVNPNGGNTQEGVDASKHTKELLEEGMELYLTYDKERTDHYGRTLAYVWLATPIENATVSQLKENMLNAKLIAQGYADCMCVEPNTKYAEVFEEIENEREQ